MLVFAQGPRTTAFKLIFRAVVHWLSEFPQSPLAAGCKIDEFVSVQCIYQLFLILLNPQDFEAVSDIYSVDFNELFSQTGVVQHRGLEELVLPVRFLQQLDCIDQLAKQHLKAALLKTSLSLNHFAFINWYQVFLVAKEEELYCVLRLLLTIGMQTSKLSTFGLTAISFLDDRDQDCLSAFLGISYSDAETGGKLDPAIKAALESESAARSMISTTQYRKRKW